MRIDTRRDILRLCDPGVYPPLIACAVLGHFNPLSGVYPPLIACAVIEHFNPLSAAWLAQTRPVRIVNQMENSLYET